MLDAKGNYADYPLMNNNNKLTELTNLQVIGYNFLYPIGKLLGGFLVDPLHGGQQMHCEDGVGAPQEPEQVGPSKPIAGPVAQGGGGYITKPSANI